MNNLDKESASRFERSRQALAERLHTLPDKPEETVDTTLRVLWHLAAGQPLSVQAAEGLPLAPLDAAACAHLDDLVSRRLDGVPLAHLTGRQHFMGLDMCAGPQALVARRETEMLGRLALDLLRELVGQAGSAKVIDVCTGSGNLAVALAHHEPRSQVHASDLSEDAAALAARNASLLRLNDRVHLSSGDLLAPFDTAAFHGSVDLVVCNPPYISSAKVPTMSSEISQFEPSLAFDGGPFGVNIIQRLVREAPRYLRPGGWLVFEVGAGQGRSVLRRLQGTPGFDDLRHAEYGGEIRVLAARRAATDSATAGGSTLSA